MKRRRVVIKLGSQIAIDESGLFATGRIEHLADAIVALKREGCDPIVVSSGAVALGMPYMDLKPGVPMKLAEVQACAALGQAQLIENYNRIFETRNLIGAQILVSSEDFAHRPSYLALRETFRMLVGKGAIPIVNENDCVSVEELPSASAERSFGDNDKLSALVAGKLGADLLLILTTTDGIYSDDPSLNLDATHIPEVKDFTILSQIRTAEKSAYGRGGASSKIEAARIASICGVTTVIAKGGDLSSVLELARNQEGILCTIIHPRKGLSDRQKWIGAHSGYQGKIVINEGARNALTHSGASLLLPGVETVEGSFDTGAVVSLQTGDETEVARGLCSFSSKEIREYIRTPKPGRSGRELIHRNDMVIFEGASAS